jgi:Flp pilus assembly protein TadD
MLGTALGVKKDWDGEIAEEREALRLNPNNASAHYCLAFALEHKHNPEEALQEYRKAYELNPQNRDYRKDYERLVKKTRP